MAEFIYKINYNGFEAARMFVQDIREEFEQKAVGPLHLSETSRKGYGFAYRAPAELGNVTIAARGVPSRRRGTEEVYLHIEGRDSDNLRVKERILELLTGMKLS